MRTVGVEEELLVVDESGKPRAVAVAALSGIETPDEGAQDGHTDDEVTGAVVGELMLQQLETGTRPCRTLSELSDELATWRRRADEAAGVAGCRAVALATSPVPVVPETTSSPRYRRMAEEFGLTQAEQLVCGCHVHVSVESDEEGVAVLDRIRGWLPVLVALSANSPYWQGLDTGYASFRSQVWRRWPSAGPTEVFGSAETYRGAVHAMVATGTVLDEGMVYFDARLSRSYPTVEVRVADVCPDREVTVMVAALVRGLVSTAAADWRAGTPAPAVSTTMIGLATWRAGRAGLLGDLVDVFTGRPRPAAEVVGALLGHVRPALDAMGDTERVEGVVARLLRDGTAADRQRAVMAETGELSAVVRDLVELTHR
ncbi:carboxylate-amine ligase [Nocardioides sp. LHG3406-4]|uniref:carboxylate-amine ligase n=1 Tax=Nocardioides sp. LHG3406-4 TaxID=2804575 RepID=UPI003CED20BA